MKYLPKVDRSDWEVVNIDPDPDFDPEKNQRVIDKVIRDNKARFARNKREFKHKTRSRHEALAMYAKHLVTTKSNDTALNYFGKKYMAELRGKQILEEILDAKKKQKITQKEV